MGCLEAVRGTGEGCRITNLDRLERKKVDDKILIALKGLDEPIIGMLVKLSGDR
jgi:hypothetical protein